VRPVGTPVTIDADVFPPLRSHAPDPSIFLPFIPEDIAFEEEYEEYLSDLGMSDEGYSADAPLFGGVNAAAGTGGAGTSAWSRLPEFVSEVADGISDSESIVSIGELGEDGRLDASNDEDENQNNWEHLSPKTMAALPGPRSPHGGPRRTSSGGNALRPVVPFGLDEGSAVDLEPDDDIEELGSREPQGPSVDEVEYAYGV